MRSKKPRLEQIVIDLAFARYDANLLLFIGKSSLALAIEKTRPGTRQLDLVSVR